MTIFGTKASIPLSFLIAIFCSSTLQAQGIGNSQDPGNWQIGATERVSGTDTAICWELDAQGNPKQQSYTYDWVEGGEIPDTAKNHTGLEKTVSWTSQGKVRVKVHWTGYSGPPTKVFLRVYGGAEYFAMDGLGGGVADNGLGHPSVDDGGRTLSGGSRGEKRRWYAVKGDSVHGYYAEVELSQSASVAATGPGMIQANAAVGGIDVSVEPRAVEAWPSGYYTTYQGEPTGKQVWGKGAFYPEVIAVLNGSRENIVGEQVLRFDIRLPIVTSARIYYGDDEQYTHLDAQGVAHGFHQPTENYKWSTTLDQRSGDLPTFLGSYEIPVVGMGNYENPLWQGNEVTLNDADGSDTGSLRYTWFDELQQTAGMQVVFHPPYDNYIKYHATLPQDDGQINDQKSNYSALSEMVASGKFSVTFVTLKKNIYFYVAQKTGSLVVKATAALPQPLTTKLMLVGAGFALDQVKVEDETDTLQESLERFQWAIANTPANGSWIVDPPAPGRPITEEVMREYRWQVFVLPLYQTDQWVANKYGSQGFEGQELKTVKWRSSSRIHYYYEYQSGPTPGPGGEV